MQTESLIGRALVCAETGESFVGAAQGCTVNYARDSAGNVFSDKGVDIRERRELLDRSRPFSCYVSQCGAYVTGWKGNTLGTITRSKQTRRRCAFGGFYSSIWARDIHGALWRGLGVAGMLIHLRPVN